MEVRLLIWAGLFNLRLAQFLLDDYEKQAWTEVTKD